MSMMMTSNLRPTLGTLLALTVLSTSGAALAHPSTSGPDGASPAGTAQTDRFELLLDSIDVVPPSRELFEQEFPDALDRLDQVARDVTRSSWSRIRAISMLSYFLEDRVMETLKLLSVGPAANLSEQARQRHIAADPEVRRQALYTLGRTFGVIADANLVRFIERRVTADPVPEVREHALRSLRWVNHDEARLALLRLQASGPKPLRELANATLTRRAQRLHAPRLGH